MLRPLFCSSLHFQCSNILSPLFTASLNKSCVGETAVAAACQSCRLIWGRFSLRCLCPFKASKQSGGCASCCCLEIQQANAVVSSVPQWLSVGLVKKQNKTTTTKKLANDTEIHTYRSTKLKKTVQIEEKGLTLW